MKNYIGFVNDHSGSMSSLARAAISDYNANIGAVITAANREMLDTIVSVVGVGIGNGGYGTTRQVVISNPHVLKPVTSWDTSGGTPLYDGIGNIIELFQSLPDYNSPNASFLVLVTTDGHEMHSKKYSKEKLRALIQSVSQDGRWTFVFRVPRGNASTMSDLGVPVGNIQEWDTTTAGMAASTVVTAKAMDTFYTTRAAGAKSSTVFYADASKVSAAAVAATLKDISGDVSLYVVPAHLNGIEIRSFILDKRAEYLKGSAFYQLTKTEPRVQEAKLIAIRNRATGAIYSGVEARKLIGLPEKGNARLHPGDHGNFDIFIQSSSTNRKLVGGTGVLYWKAIGVPFTAADEAYLQPKPVVPAVVQLPKVAVTNKPTKSPIPVTTKAVVVSATVNGRAAQFFVTRDQARDTARKIGRRLEDLANYTNPTLANTSGRNRWFVFTE
jgi:hypothetical protein